MKRTGIKRFFAAVLSAVLVVGLMPLPAFAETGSEQQGETPLTTAGFPDALTAQDNIPSPDSPAVQNKMFYGFGLGFISNPKNGAGGWNKVYFGSQDEPILFYVLSTNDANFGTEKPSLLLQSVNAVRKNMNYGTWRQWTWEWQKGTNAVRPWLNGEFLETRLTPQEQSILMASHKTARSASDGSGDLWRGHSPYSPLNHGEKVFLLDDYELTNKSYGFEDDGKGNIYTKSTLRKRGDGQYWTRTTQESMNSGAAKTVTSSGMFSYMDRQSGADVIPAMNLDKSKILFSSSVGTGTYKLTLEDEGKEFACVNATKDGNKITVPYTIAGGNAQYNRISAVLTSGDSWGQGRVYAYFRLNYNDNGDGTGTAVLTLPNGFYEYYAPKIYVFAEQVNGEHSTDYASVPVKLDLTGKIQATASGYSRVYDGQEHGITVNATGPNGMQIKYGTAEGQYDLDASPTYKDVTNGAKTVYYQVTAEGYAPVTGSATVEITPRPVTVSGITADKTYDGTLTATPNYDNVVFDGAVDGDDLKVTAEVGEFADSDAEAGKKVSITDLSLGGVAAGNYQLSAGCQSEILATIARKPVIVESGITAEDKKYDGNTYATLDFTNAVINGVVPADEGKVTVTGKGTFDTPPCGRGQNGHD